MPPKSLKLSIGSAIATLFGIGNIRVAPGTWGSLLALLLWLPFLHRPLWLQLLVVGIAFVLAVWAAAIQERIRGKHDLPEIVIDELVGMWITALFVPLSLFWLIIAFFTFRFFDILKPGPIRWLDRHVGGGLGVVVDDAAAGLLAGSLLLLAQYLMN